VSAFGEVVGTAVVAESEYYDATKCEESKLATVNGSSGIGLFASERGGWQPPERPARWEPPQEARESLARFVTEAEQLLLDEPIPWDGLKPLPQLEERTLYFTGIPTAYGGERSPHQVVVGGAFLLIAYENDEGRWILTYYDATFARGGGEPPYLPLAVVDLDGDDIPEIIVHENAGESWSDVVLALDEDHLRWEVVARSIGGATI
jgi:hypothetical protein